MLNWCQNVGELLCFGVKISIITPVSRVTTKTLKNDTSAIVLLLNYTHNNGKRSEEICSKCDNEMPWNWNDYGWEHAKRKRIIVGIFSSGVIQVVLSTSFRIIDLINLILHLSHISKCTFRKRKMHIFILKGVLWTMGQVQFGICETGLFSGTVGIIRQTQCQWGNSGGYGSITHITVAAFTNMV